MGDNKREIKGMGPDINYEPQNSGRNHNMGRHNMETLYALLVLCEGNPPVTGGSLHKGQVIWSFDITLLLA